jgi:DNA-binding NarL/FixJ family response regulator
VAILQMRDWRTAANDSLSGRDAVRTLRRIEPGIGIVVRGSRPERHLVTDAFAAGATAFVTHAAAAELLRDAVASALQSRRFVDPAVPPRGSRAKLTRRQRELLQLLADGNSTTIAARTLELSEETVKTHTRNILARLEARNRTHAVAIALRESLIE